MGVIYVCFVWCFGLMLIVLLVVYSFRYRLLYIYLRCFLCLIVLDCVVWTLFFVIVCLGVCV